MQLRQLDQHMLVAGQVQAADFESLAAQGVTLIVNNRPDGEQAGQPSAAELAFSAEAAGIDYLHLPVSGGFSAEQIERMAEALNAANGTTLAFCASGTRSTFLWALARASKGDDGEALIGKAEAAGYDLTPIHSYLLAGASNGGS